MLPEDEIMVAADDEWSRLALAFISADELERLLQTVI